MRQHNYCFDACEHNTIPRRSFKDGDKFIVESTGERNMKLRCRLGYKQTVASEKALKNSVDNGTTICERLRKVFAKGGS